MESPAGWSGGSAEGASEGRQPLTGPRLPPPQAAQIKYKEKAPVPAGHNRPQKRDFMFFIRPQGTTTRAHCAHLAPQTAHSTRTLRVYCKKPLLAAFCNIRLWRGALPHYSFSVFSLELASPLPLADFLTGGIPVRSTRNLLTEGLRWMGCCIRHFVGHLSTQAAQ